MTNGDGCMYHIPMLSLNKERSLHINSTAEFVPSISHIFSLLPDDRGFKH